LDRYVQTYYPNRTILLSPFFGGGSLELHFQAKRFQIRANDLFTPLYTFWKMLQERPHDLKARVKARMPITKEVFQHMRNTIQTLTDPMDIAVSYYIINRCSFSGATFCGGFSQEASTKRLNESCMENLTNVSLTNITFSNLDCCAFLNQYPEQDNTLLYADPPYYITNYIYGKDGDMHAEFDHKAFAEAIRKRKDWIVSYNDCPYIRTLYAGCRFFTETWSYGMNATKQSSEIVILPPL
jgi:DNA adenine methylase